MPNRAIEQFPHCDPNVLHARGECEHCDGHPDWQELREVWGINFTGKSDPDKVPCPSARFRPARHVHRWPGNRPTNVELTAKDLEDPTVYDRLNDED